MKKVFSLLMLMAAPAAAQDFRSACCEGRGNVSYWPGVSQARYEASLCPAELMALIGRQQMALTYRSPTVRFQASTGGYQTAPARPASASLAPMMPLPSQTSPFRPEGRRDR